VSKNRYTLYSDVLPFYEELVASMDQAKHEITMMYLIFDHGEYSTKMKEILTKKMADGLRVRLMVDYFGTLVDRKRNTVKNLRLLRELKDKGVEVIQFQPSGPRLSIQDRMHIKICAIDSETVFIGGSNIGDNYPEWQDSNLKIEGQFGRSGHEIYDYVAAHSSDGGEEYEGTKTNLDLSTWQLGDAEVLLTVPGFRRDICYGLIDLMLNTRETIYIRQWYFLPNEEFMNIMLSQLERGVALNVLLSHRTKVPIVDWANPNSIATLVNAGAQIFRFEEKFMHSKIAWNDEGNVIFGSANLEERGLSGNFELCVKIKDLKLSQQLTQRFNTDKRSSDHQSKERVAGYPLNTRIVSKILNAFSPFL